MRSYFPCKNLLKTFFKWLADTQMKTNEDKCHLIVKRNKLTEIQIGNFLIKYSGIERLLDVNIGSKLNCDCHVNHSCNKANKKTSKI